MYRFSKDFIRFEDQETETANNMPLYTQCGNRCLQTYSL